MSHILTIGDRKVGPGHPCLVVAEVAQAHDGSLGTAHAYIDAAANAGADAVKFQTHIADAESTPGEPFRIRFSPQDETRYDYWKRMEFTESQFEGLARHAAERDLLFLSTPFSCEAVALLERVGVPAWKIGAGEVIHRPMLEDVRRTGKPVILSTGMATWEEIDAAVALFPERCAVMQCTTSYPCPPERLGLNVMQELRERYGGPVGLSDHSGTIFAGLAAATLGADIVEVHIVLSRECFGPDTTSSVTSRELRQLVDGIRFIETALANPVGKDAAAESMADLRRIFGRSLVAARDLEEGATVAEGDIAVKKPGGGLPPDRRDDLIGRRLRRPVERGNAFEEDDFE